MFKKVSAHQNFPEMELAILEKWCNEGIFELLLNKNSDKKMAVFFDGPPFANGKPHYGHILQSVLKDAMSRYLTMRGFFVPRIPGWDCHGLPVENEVEKRNNIKNKADIEKIGVEKFNDDCRASVFEYTAEFENVFERIARFVDVKKAYATKNTDYMESVWWVFKQIWDKGLVYKGYKPMHISTVLETPLSNFEVSQNYKDITDLAVTVKFKLVDEADTFLLAWTTTPWTLPGNQALAVNKNLEYVMVQFDGKKYILAESRLNYVFKDKEYKFLKKIDISSLLNKKYKPVFDYYAFSDEKNFRILHADFVGTDVGTGIVHIAGGFGEDDFNLVNREGMTPIIHVLINGNFKEEVKDFAGKYVRSQDQNIAEFLSKKSLLFSKENYRHSYPHCWRTDTPLLNYVTSSWFIEVTKVKNQMIKNNQLINWQPNHLRDGRFGKWLDGARDWSISRSRFWGCPIPVWENENGDVICVGSIEELKKYTGGVLPLREGEIDLHKPYIDEITFMHPDHLGSNDAKFLMKRVTDVFDCWFESGSMPYAQLHYPFENKDKFEMSFPADFIIEAVDQTRGWFYTLHVLATILYDKPAFKNVICTGHILGDDGEKLSKRKKNYVDPNDLFSRVGVDPMRFFLCSSPIVVGDSIKMSEKTVEDVLKKFTLTIWNTYSFFVTYANIDNFSVDESIKNFVPTAELDKWILSELNALIKSTTDSMNAYNMQKATRPMYDFVDNLSNWYVRRSRRRFWKSENDDDKNNAYITLYIVLETLSKLIAPFMPFLAEEIFVNLTGEKSVHLSDWPVPDEGLIDSNLNYNVALIRRIVALGHSVRDDAVIKVRQPLASVKIALPEGYDKSYVLRQDEIIKEELNVKSMEIIDDVGDSIKPVFTAKSKVLGPKYGQETQKIINALKNGDYEYKNGKLTANGIVLLPEEYETGYVSLEGVTAKSDSGLTVILDTIIDEKLLYEGYARDLIRFVQELRKEVGFEVSDRIVLNVSAVKPVSDAITFFADYIAKETLADEIQQSKELLSFDAQKSVDIDFVPVRIMIKKQI